MGINKLREIVKKNYFAWRKHTLIRLAIAKPISDRFESDFTTRRK